MAPAQYPFLRPNPPQLSRLGAELTQIEDSGIFSNYGPVNQELERAFIDALTGRMAALAQAEVATWPVGEPLELWGLTRRLMRPLAIELLFGSDPEGYRLADLASELMEGKWSRGAFIPVNLPFTPYGRMVRTAERLERRLIDWIGLELLFDLLRGHCAHPEAGDQCGPDPCHGVLPAEIFRQP